MPGSIAAPLKSLPPDVNGSELYTAIVLGPTSTSNDKRSVHGEERVDVQRCALFSTRGGGGGIAV